MKINDICTFATKSTIKAGEAVKDGTYMFFTSSAEESKRYDEYQLDCEGIIMGTGGNATIHYYNGKFATSTDCIVLLPKKNIRCKYLYYYLRAHMDILNAGFKGAGLKHTNKKYISSIDVGIIPSFDIQDKTIKVLNSIERIIDKKNKEIVYLDLFIKARFVEMFGDPLLNPMEWEIKAIGEIATDIRYGTSKPAVENGKFPYLRMNNLTLNGELDLSDLKYINISEEELEKCIVKKGDILFNRTNSIDLIGKTAMFNLDIDMVIAGYIIRVRLNEELKPEILAQYMNLEAIKDRLKGIAKGAVNQANINAQELKSIKIYIPDMNAQKNFIEIKNQVDKSKVVLNIN